MYDESLDFIFDTYISIVFVKETYISLSLITHFFFFANESAKAQTFRLKKKMAEKMEHATEVDLFISLIMCHPDNCCWQ